MTYSLAGQIKNVFSIIEPVGGWPEGYGDWTEEEQDEYYSEHSLLNVKTPPPTQEQFDKYLAEMQETSGKIMEWLEASI
jgi:hypothetical protein